MAIARSKVSAAGRISVPAAVQRRLGICPGSVLEGQDEGEKVMVRRVARYTSEDVHHALFATRPRRRTLRQLETGLKAYFTRRCRAIASLP